MHRCKHVPLTHNKKTWNEKQGRYATVTSPNWTMILDFISVTAQGVKTETFRIKLVLATLNCALAYSHRILVIYQKIKYLKNI